MTPREQAERFQSKLNSKNILFTLVGPYSSANNAKLLFRCTKGHEFKADKNRVVAGKVKCPTCPGTGRRRTHEGYENDLLAMEAPLYPIEPYKGTEIKIKHMCINDHIVEIAPKTVLGGTGCAYCSGMKKKTPEEYIELLAKKNIKYIPVDDYNGMMNKIKHKCYVCEHIWNVKPHDIVNGSGCPACAKNGFNSTKSAILYYARLWDGNDKYYKIGITNGPVDVRLKATKKEYKILYEKYYETGKEAKAVEDMILEEYKEFKVYAPQFLPRGGYTELFSHDVLEKDF